MKKTIGHASKRAPKLNHDRFDYFRTDLTLDKGILAGFAAVAAKDGMKPDAALAFLMRWAVSQGTLCPITSAPQSLVPELERLHRNLTQALRQVKIEARDYSDEDDDGEAWKGGDR